LEINLAYKDKNKQREFQRNWLARRRSYAITVFGGKCLKCNSSKNLNFDHIDRNKKISHNIWSWSSKRVKAELEKCQLLCFECHKNKTRIEVYGERQHGTITMYKHGKCRCSYCKKANAERQANRRKNKKLEGVVGIGRHA
jgi:hypothetical protein